MLVVMISPFNLLISNEKLIDFIIYDTELEKKIETNYFIVFVLIGRIPYSDNFVYPVISASNMLANFWS